MKRASGEGHVSQRADGRWHASLMLDGVRKFCYARTEREARKKLMELQRQAHTLGALPDAGNRTLNDLLDAWLDTSAPNLKPRTLVTYREQCQRHIRPALGALKLSRVTPDRIQALYARYQKAGKHSTAQRLHVILHRAFALAVLWRWLPENPCERVLRPAAPTKRRDVWTEAELAAFLDGAREHWLWPFWMVAIASGCRSGELLALTWQDVNLVAGTLTVSKSLQRVGGECVIQAPKTLASRRTIALPAEAIAALKRQRAQQARWRLRAGGAWAGLDLVFTTEMGRPLQRSVPYHALLRECRRLGLPALTVHGLRHLHASLLIARGMPIPMVAKRLGHASPGITLQVYAHVVKREDADAADAISRALVAGRQALEGEGVRTGQTRDVA